MKRHKEFAGWRSRLAQSGLLATTALCLTPVSLFAGVIVDLTTNQTVYKSGDPLLVKVHVINEGTKIATAARVWVTFPDNDEITLLSQKPTLPSSLDYTKTVLNMKVPSDAAVGVYTFSATLNSTGPTGALLASDSETVSVSQEGVSINLADYWPMKDGDARTWHEWGSKQDGYSWDEQETETVAGTVTFNGYAAKKVVDLGDDEADYFAIGPEGLYYYGSQEWEGAVFETETLDPPLYLPSPMLGGVPVTQTVVKTESPSGEIETTQYTSTFLGFEDVTVPAGHFTGCAVVFVQERVLSGEDTGEYDSTTLWFAKGIGLVREQGTDYEVEDGPLDESYQRELVSAVVGGATYP